ncbi:hypothetical protein F5144DRAFT_288692 [Chaetomium tenue]|uniref:Uncharacterized protein n=1 Tax=Chaetomium tenue TaxID=1854479 RepID=A0ACB7P1R0_9PEZI|nr:hypothetical protein F5144DRAFT_288692 [Chaetomium globosum]
MEPTTHCTICTTPLSPTRPHPTFPCSHTHCLPCLRRNFTLSTGTTTTPTAGTFRPVQCCPGARLPLRELRAHLHLQSAETAAYRARLAEHDAAEKLYCAVAGCGRFIPVVLRDGRSGRCRGCHGRTCVRCGGRAHVGMGVCDGVMGRVPVGGVAGGKRAALEEEAEMGFRRVVREMGWYVFVAFSLMCEQGVGCCARC